MDKYLFMSSPKHQSFIMLYSYIPNIIEFYLVSKNFAFYQDQTPDTGGPSCLSGAFLILPPASHPLLKKPSGISLTAPSPAGGCSLTRES